MKRHLISKCISVLLLLSLTVTGISLTKANFAGSITGVAYQMFFTSGVLPGIFELTSDDFNNSTDGTVTSENKFGGAEYDENGNVTYPGLDTSTEREQYQLENLSNVTFSVKNSSGRDILIMFEITIALADPNGYAGDTTGSFSINCEETGGTLSATGTTDTSNTDPNVFWLTKEADAPALYTQSALWVTVTYYPYQMEANPQKFLVTDTDGDGTVDAAYADSELHDMGFILYASDDDIVYHYALAVNFSNVWQSLSDATYASIRMIAVELDTVNGVKTTE